MIALLFCVLACILIAKLGSITIILGTLGGQTVLITWGVLCSIQGLYALAILFFITVIVEVGLILLWLRWRPRSVALLKIVSNLLCTDIISIAWVVVIFVAVYLAWYVTLDFRSRHEILLNLIHYYRAVVFAICMLGAQQFADINGALGIAAMAYVLFSWYWTTQGEFLMV